MWTPFSWIIFHRFPNPSYRLYPWHTYLLSKLNKAKQISPTCGLHSALSSSTDSHSSYRLHPWHTYILPKLNKARQISPTCGLHSAVSSSTDSPPILYSTLYSGHTYLLSKLNNPRQISPICGLHSAESSSTDSIFFSILLYNFCNLGGEFGKKSMWLHAYMYFQTSYITK